MFTYASAAVLALLFVKHFVRKIDGGHEERKRGRNVRKVICDFLVDARWHVLDERRNVVDPEGRRDLDLHAGGGHPNLPPLGEAIVRLLVEGGAGCHGRRRGGGEVAARGGEAAAARRRS